MNGPTSVLIVGGGASGLLVAVNLLRRCKSPLKINFVNDGYNFGTGIAFHPSSDSHLLNVMTCNMSAFPEIPDHFVKWLVSDHAFADVEIETLAKTYLPRRIYGEYLLSVWKNALEQKPEYIEVNVINDRLIDLSGGEKLFTGTLQSGHQVESNSVVLALGNALPRNPEIPNPTFYRSPFYFNNPWYAASVEHLAAEEDVLIIGNGLTMVDTALSFMERKHKGTIYSVSPHGFGILQHRHNGVPYNGLVRELEGTQRLLCLIRLFNKHIKKVRRLGLSAEPVIDSIRPYTQSLWMSFKPEEKKMFIARLRHLWGVARHRLPIQVFDTIQKLKLEGRLKVWAGKIVNLSEEGGQVKVELFDKKAHKKQVLKVGRVINCTGPESDINRVDDALVRQMLKKGMISSDPLKLGLMADPSSLQVINQQHQTMESLYAIGGLLRGMFWESTAIPEIRVQAKHIADHIIIKASNPNLN